MKTVQIGQKDSFDIKNADVRGFLIKIRGTGSGVNTDPVDVPYKPKINIKLKQGNSFNDTILDGSILGLAKGTAGKNDQWIESDANGYRVITTAAAAVVGVLEWLYFIHFPSVINLNGDDVMTVEIDFPSDSLSSHNTTGSYLSIKPLPGIGSQMIIPKLKEYIMPQTDTRYETFLGDDITRIVFVGAATHRPDEDGLQEIDIQSDRRNYVMEAEEIIYEGTINESEAVVALNVEHDNVKVKCAMDGSSNAAGDLRMIVSSYYTDSTLVSKGVERKNWQNKYLLEKIS